MPQSGFPIPSRCGGSAGTGEPVGVGRVGEAGGDQHVAPVGAGLGDPALQRLDAPLAQLQDRAVDALEAPAVVVEHPGQLAAAGIEVRW